MSQAVLHSPIGPILIIADGDHIASVTIGHDGPSGEDQPLLREALAQLDAWFAGQLQHFDLPLTPSPTARGAIHREAIAAIGYGDTASYGELARRISSGPRAIGQACRRNPFPVIIPCHRVIGAGGTIGHYSGGAGIETKIWLLGHEQRHATSKGR
jgi:methylated-DNA-[protein]-cysteine S-methyltransferase